MRRPPRGLRTRSKAALPRLHPLVVAGIGIVALALFLFLMIWKPF